MEIRLLIIATLAEFYEGGKKPSLIYWHHNNPRHNRNRNTQERRSCGQGSGPRDLGGPEGLRCPSGGAWALCPHCWLGKNKELALWSDKTQTPSFASRPRLQGGLQGGAVGVVVWMRWFLGKSPEERALLWAPGVCCRPWGLGGCLWRAPTDWENPQMPVGSSARLLGPELECPAPLMQLRAECARVNWTFRGRRPRNLCSRPS